MNKRERISQIMSGLEQTGEDLLDLSDDIWLSIDHNDPAELEAGISFKREYNEAIAEFAQVSARIQGLITGFTAVEADDEATPADADAAEHQRVIRELDRGEPHSLDEDFKYKRPYGFVFGGYAVKDLRTWRAMYERVCAMVHARVGDRFAEVTEAQEFGTVHGNRMFAADPSGMRAASQVAPGVYAEINLAANNIRDRIREVLEYFGFEVDDFLVYLRQDRDAEERS